MIQMKKLKLQLSILILLTVCFTNILAQTQVAQSLNTKDNFAKWYVKEDKGATPQALLSDNNDWLTATVPGTVFTDFVNAGIEKDPNFGDNIYRVDRDKYNKSYWYKTTFKTNVSLMGANKNVWLNFDGINRFGHIYFNGKDLGELRGMMERGRYNVTKLLNKSGDNTLLIKISLPNQRRHPEEKFANLASPTYLSSAGWDWMPYVPGLNTGITDNVYLTTTQEIALLDTWVRTKLQDKNQIANLEISAQLENTTAKTKIITVNGIINPGNINFSQNVVVAANTTQGFVFNASNIPQLSISNPKLWWPNGLGDANLYNCKLTIIADKKLSDQKEVNFGIKEYSYRTEANNVFHVSINGKKVFLKGGNWGMSEYLLRCRGQEYFTKVRLHKELNYNVIRNWMGSITDKEFYEACDKYGIMIWDDFWLNSKFDVPEFANDFNKNAIEKIKRFRNHPSVMIWCGENEGTPGTNAAGENFDANLAKFVSIYDSGDRHYQSDSRKGNGLSGSGLWKNYKPSFYFADASNSIFGDTYPKGKGWGLRSEIGTAVFTTYESFKKFIPAENLWPRNEMWNKHFFGPLAKNGGPDVYENALNYSYGKANNIEEFCEKAQLLNIETNKAMYEGWLNHLWDDASGIMIWMSQSAYPSLVWQTYDYYYDLTGAYWGVKKACEPLHILWNSNDNSVKLVNTTLNDYKGLQVSADIFNIKGERLSSLSKKEIIDISSNTVKTAFRINSENLAFEKNVTASSTKAGNSKSTTDVNLYTTWKSNEGENQWISVDLEEPEEIGNVRLVWADDFAKSYTIMFSSDAKNWKSIYTTNEGDGKTDNIKFDVLKARYIKVQMNASSKTKGYELSGIEIKKKKIENQSDVNFLRLVLKNSQGQVITTNDYWFGENENDYNQLSTLPKTELAYHISRREVKDGKYYLDLKITNKGNTPAFGVRARLVDKETQNGVLPVIQSDNYLILMPNEVKYIYFEYDDVMSKNVDSQVLIKQYMQKEEAIY